MSNQADFSKYLDAELPAKSQAAQRAASQREYKRREGTTNSARPGGPTPKKREPGDVIAKLSLGGQAYIEALHGIALDEPDATTTQRMEALKLLLAYLYGRPTQRSESVEQVDVTARLLPDMTDEQIEAMLAEEDE